MSEVQAAPKLQKWPFYLADVVLSGIAAYVLTRFGLIQGVTQMVITLGCLSAAAWGAWLSITPWMLEYRTHSALAENNGLKSTLEQIQSLEKVADLIRQANSQWQGVQDASGRTLAGAREIADKMKVETDEFMKFIENAHNQERAGLRLEVDKLRKMEGDWIKVAVQMLDHTFALYRAAERSGQEALVMQLGQFQNACRDAARRMGLAPFVPSIGEKYDQRGHQLANPPSVIDENATVSEVLATGFTYQGQLLRRALVSLNDNVIEEPALVQSATIEPMEVSREPMPGTPAFADAPESLPEETASENPERNRLEGRQRQGPPLKPSLQNELPLV